VHIDCIVYLLTSDAYIVAALGVFSDEEDDAGVEMLLSVEEQFQRSLDHLRDAVIVAHGSDIRSVEGTRR